MFQNNASRNYGASTNVSGQGSFNTSGQQSTSSSGSYVDPTKLGLYKNMLAENQSRYGTVMQQYGMQHKAMRDQLPGVYKDFGGLKNEMGQGFNQLGNQMGQGYGALGSQVNQTLAGQGRAALGDITDRYEEIGRAHV